MVSVIVDNYFVANLLQIYFPGLIIGSNDSVDNMNLNKFHLFSDIL